MVQFSPKLLSKIKTKNKLKNIKKEIAHLQEIKVLDKKVNSSPCK